jgi:hypothetical protein
MGSARRTIMNLVLLCSFVWSVFVGRAMHSGFHDAFVRLSGLYSSKHNNNHDNVHLFFNIWSVHGQKHGNIYRYHL